MKQEEIQEVRDFNRFYTNIIGLLDNHFLNSAYTLPEARVLYELAHYQPCTASKIMESIKIDKGYLSRTLKSFEKRGLLTKKENKEDGRSSTLVLTAKGNSEFSKINAASILQITESMSKLKPAKVKELLRCMQGIKQILNEQGA